MLVDKQHKGLLQLIGALELSTNQLTYFYSSSKNSVEMIKLIHALSKQYHDQQKLYLSWDCAGWHTSRKLADEVTKLNQPEYRQRHHSPAIEIVPLPTSAQFLNVIESVFSGMAKAIIHNSDYQSLAECQHAVDCYFAERNKHFLENPQRAGKKIWGKEVVKPLFNPANNCKRTNDK